MPRKNRPLEIQREKNVVRVYRYGVLVGFALDDAHPATGKRVALAGVWFPDGSDMKEETFDDVDEAVEWAVSYSLAIQTILAY